MLVWLFSERRLFSERVDDTMIVDVDDTTSVGASPAANHGDTATDDNTPAAARFGIILCVDCKTLRERGLWSMLFDEWTLPLRQAQHVG
jgi:hypothetical protein